MNLWKTNLMVRLVSYFLLLSLMSAGVVGYITYYFAREALKQSVFDRLHAVATLKEDDLKRWIEQQHEDLLFATRLPEFKTHTELLLRESNPTPEQEAAYLYLSEYLTAVVHQKLDFQEIFILNSADGEIVLSTNKENEGQHRSQDSYFIEGQSGDYVQNVYVSPVTGELAMTIATPLLSEDGQLLGVLATHLNLARMDEIILHRTGMGESGETYLVDKHNSVVSGRRFDAREFPRGLHTEGINAALLGHSGDDLYENYEGVPVIGHYRWIEGLELALLAEMRQSEAFAPAQKLAWYILSVGLVSALLLAGGVSWLSYHIAQPIVDITSIATQVAKGDFTPVAPVYSEDQIGTLARAFNKMTAQLRLLYSGLENKVAELQQAEGSLQRYARRLEAQHEIDQAILAAQSPEEIATGALKHLGYLIPYRRASVVVFDLEFSRINVIAVDGQLEEQALAEQMDFQVYENLKHLQDLQIHLVTDLSQLSQLSALEEQLLEFGILSYISVPLIWREELIGVLHLASDKANTFNAEHLEIAREVADQLAVAIQQVQLSTAVKQQFIEKMGLFEKAQQEIRERQWAEHALQKAHDELEQRVMERTAELTLLNRASQDLISTLDLDQVLVTVLEELRNLLDVVACSVWLVDGATGELVCRQSSGPNSERVRGWRLPPGKGIVGWAIEQGLSLVVDDAESDERYHPDLAQSINLTTRSLLTVPLMIQGRAIGCLQALDSQVGRFDQSELALMESLAATAAVAIENARLYKQARQDAEIKAILLREVNHRVKNNLSAIIGLLYAERRHANLKDQDAYQSIMQDLINRVQGLATVHSMLSLSEWAPISLSELIRRVIFSSLRALPPHKRLFVNVNPSTVYVTSDQANSLAIIINELATNTIKYGMTEQLIGHIDVCIETEGDNILFKFQDDGPGYPCDVLAKSDPRFNVGFHLIGNIVRISLDGDLQLHNRTKDTDNGSGAAVTIQFKQRQQGSGEPAGEKNSLILIGENGG